ncbi:MAG: PEP-CTERM sorting domain-containing protein [Phycisphaerales bacterium]|nr:PEP-CTERM sorting domain-containing protein [Phycisphaerales bacterium]
MQHRNIRRMASVFVGTLAISTLSAWAVNPTNWTTDLLEVSSSTPNASWTSSTPIDLGYPEYQYSYSIIQADGHTSLGWLDIMGQFDPSDLTGNGTIGVLPATLSNMDINENSNGTTITGNISMSVDSNGYGHLDLTNFSISGLLDGARAKADITITGVPEPTSFGMLALLGGLFLPRRRH